MCVVRVLHVKPFFLSVDMHAAHPVSVPILPPMETQALWSQNNGTADILDCNALTRADNARACHRTEYNR